MSLDWVGVEGGREEEVACGVWIFANCWAGEQFQNFYYRFPIIFGNFPQSCMNVLGAFEELWIFEVNCLF